MRPLRYSINVTLDGCCHHEAGLPPDEESMRYWTAQVEQAGAMLFGRVSFEMMESAWRRPATGTWPDWMAGWEVPFAETHRPGRRSTSCRARWAVSIGMPSWCEATWGKRSGGSSRSQARVCWVGGVTLPLALAESGSDRRVRVPRAAGPCRARADVARRSARAHPAASSWTARSSVRGRWPCNTGPRELRPEVFVLARGRSLSTQRRREVALPRAVCRPGRASPTRGEGPSSAGTSRCSSRAPPASWQLTIRRHCVEGPRLGKGRGAPHPSGES